MSRHTTGLSIDQNNFTFLYIISFGEAYMLIINSVRMFRKIDREIF